MDWIEHWFSLAPDNGDGTVELLILAALCAAAIALFIWLGPGRLGASRRAFPKLRQGLTRRGPN
jgi:hypothetical protein